MVTLLSGIWFENPFYLQVIFHRLVICSTFIYSPSNLHRAAFTASV